MDKCLRLKICLEQPHGESTDGNIYLLHYDANGSNFIDSISLFHSSTSNNFSTMKLFGKSIVILMYSEYFVDNVSTNQYCHNFGTSFHTFVLNKSVTF